jgi:hypothetical protein
VRVELGDKPFEQVVRVPTAGTARVIYPASSQPLSSSAAVVHGSSSLHEYTGDYTRQLSRSTADVVLGSGARLVVLASRHNPADSAPIKFQSVRLLDKDGVRIADLARRPAAKGPTDPNLAAGFAAEVNPGGLVLEWKEDTMESCWRQPLWVPQGYVMLVFVTVPPNTSAPQIASASIHLANLHEGFEPRSGSAPAAEVALESIRTGRQLLSQERLQRDLLEQKFQNPMLGIYGAHMVLQRSMSESEKLQILTEVLHNLELLIPGSPDVAALRLMSSRLQPATVQQPPCSWPPMMRLGYLAFRDGDWNQPGGFIEGSSLADRIRTGLASGGVWSKWSAERSSLAEFPGANSMEVMQTILNRLTHTAKSIGYDPAAESGSDFASAITHAAQQLGGHLLSGFAPVLLGRGAGFGNVDLGRLANEINSVLRSTAQGERGDYEDLAWTGLNKKQIQEVAMLLQSALPH